MYSKRIYTQLISLTIAFMVHLRVSCFIKYQYVLTPQKNFSVKIQMSFQVIILLTDIYISSSLSNTIKDWTATVAVSQSIMRILVQTQWKGGCFFCWFAFGLVFFFAWNKSPFQEKEHSFDACYLHNLKCFHTHLWLFHLYNNQLKHTFDSVAVSVLWKVLKMRKSESHILTEA